MQLHRGLRKIVRTLGVATGVAMASVAAAEPPCVEQWADALEMYDWLGVTSMVSFDDGGGELLYIASHYEKVASVTSLHVAAYDGLNWHALGEGFNDSATVLTIYDDGTGPAVYAGGRFTASGETTLNHIARWDGEQWLPVGDGVDCSHVRAMTVHDDGSGPKLVAVAVPAVYQDPHRIHAWDGNQWELLVDDVEDRIRAVSSWDDGDGPALYVGGSFHEIGGVAADGLARYRGGEWSELGDGLGGPFYDNGSTSDLAVYDDGTGEALFVTGWFDGAGDTDAMNIAKWTGSEWQVVNDWTTDGPNAYFDEMATFDDGTGEALYIGRTEGQTGLYRWDGEVATLLGTDDPRLDYVTMAPSGLLGGRLAVASSGRLYFWNNAAQQWENHYDHNIGAAFINALEVHDDGSGPALYAAGSFESNSPIIRRRGDAWETIPSPGGRVYDLAATTNGGQPLLYATGAGWNDNYLSGQIAAWNGSEWLPLGTGLEDAYSSWGTCIAVMEQGDNHDLYVSGRFTSAGGITAKRIARWDGSRWQALGSGLSNDADAMLVADVGNGPMLYAIGGFSNAGGLIVGGIAAWDGEQWHDLGGGFDGLPTAMAVMQENGRDVVYVAGRFSLAGGVSVDGFARWDGGRWLPAVPKPADVVWDLRALDTPTGRRLVALTATDLGGGDWRSSAWRLDGSVWFELGTFDNLAETTAIFDDGSGPALYVGGDFDRVGDLYSRGIARRNLCDPDDIVADLDGDGVIDQVDLGLLLAAYDTCAGDDFYDARADLTGDACVNHADLGAFLQAYPQ